MQAFKCAVGWKQPDLTTRTLEERRAALGCFLITSWYANDSEVKGMHHDDINDPSLAWP